MRPFLRFGECSSKISADSFLLEQISLEVTMDVSILRHGVNDTIFFLGSTSDRIIGDIFGSRSN
jgi:hypothetical protein